MPESNRTPKLPKLVLVGRVPTEDEDGCDNQLS